MFKERFHFETKKQSPKTYYDVLGVLPDAGQKEISQAFHELSKKYHPDIGGDEEIYKHITEAYTVLKNPKDRRRYDEKLKTPERHFAEERPQQPKSPLEKAFEESRKKQEERKKAFERRKDYLRKREKEQEGRRESFKKKLDDARKQLERAQKQTTINMEAYEEAEKILEELDKEIKQKQAV